MMRAAILFSLLGGVSAFAPLNVLGRGMSPRKMSDASVAAEEPAAEVPVVPSGFCRGYVGGEGPEPIFGFVGGSGSKNFDPLNFCERAPEWVPWFREAELKHGRAAMLATVGIVVPEIFRIPGDQFSFASVPKVIDAFDACPDSISQIILWISLLEAMSFAALANMNNYDRRPGDFSFDPLGLYPETEEKQREMQLKELKNGRLAMIAIGGMVTQSAITGHGFPYV